ncbi:MAG: LysM peptidoglycan-binding domain-containing protein, partial [Dehalococcoidia bacterium]|nr:LysM peptidoglycan-binding domain-containing protein [Dehalococcoidia bacterium]
MPTLSLVNETAYSYYSDGYSFRPSQPYSSGALTARRGEAFQGLGSLENKVASSVMTDKSDLEASGVLQQTLPGGPSEQSSGNREGRPVNLPEESRITNYEVQAGDTVSTIAERFGVSQDTILSANSLRNADFIKQGQVLAILPVSGLLHVVENGDSLLYIAIKYGVDTEDILGYKPNNITDPHS